jgi:O-antigen/teichoic acid export membrane protein
VIAVKHIVKFYKSNQFWVLADQLLASGAAFLITIIIARTLPITDFGWYASVVLFQLLLLAIQNAVLTSPYQVLQASYNTAEKYNYLKALFKVESVLLLFIALLALLFFILAPVWLQPFMERFWWVAVLVCGYLLQDFLRRVLITESKPIASFITNTVYYAIGGCSLLYLHSINAITLTNIICVLGFSYLPSVFVAVYFINQFNSSTKDERIATQQCQTGATELVSFKSTVRLHMHHGKWLLLTAVLQWWAGNVFFVAAGVLLGVEAFGALRLAQNIFGLLNVLFQAFENYVVPNAARVYQQSATMLSGYLKTISKKSVLLLLPILVVLFVLAPQVFTLAGGAQYASYYSLIQVMCGLYLLIFLGYPVRIAIRVMLLNKAFFIGYVTSTVFSVLAARPMVAWLGINGVVAGLLINQVLLIGYWLYVLKQKNFVLWK